MVQFGCRSATAGMRSTSQRVLCSVYICVCPISRALRSFTVNLHMVTVSRCQPLVMTITVLPASLPPCGSSPSACPSFSHGPDPHVRLGMSLLDFVPLEFLRVKSSAFEVCVNVDTNAMIFCCVYTEDTLQSYQKGGIVRKQTALEITITVNVTKEQ